MKFKMYALTVLWVLASASHANAESIATALEKCSNVENTLKRLVCYDQLSQQANGYEDSQLPVANRPTQPGQYSAPAIAGTAPAALPPAAQQRAARSSEDNFGLPPLQVVEQKQIDSLVATVTKKDKTLRGKLIFTLDNGHVWTQSDTESFLVKVGDQVRIEKGLLGGHFLNVVSSKKRIRVKRSK